jgi:hypothetical protein
MTQLQLWVVIAAPSVLALIGILLNQKGLHGVEARLSARMDRLDGRMDRLEGRMDRMMEIWHNDVQGLLGMISDHGQRIVRLEERRNPSH